MLDSALRYSPITDRRAYRLPGGATLAVWIVPNVEYYRYGPAGSANVFDIGAFGVRDYGNRAGFARLMGLLDDYELRLTVSLNLECYRAFPEIMRYCEDRRLDVMCHGETNSDAIGGMSVGQQADYIGRCQEDFIRLTGRRFSGWFSPAGGSTEATLPAAGLAGVRYMVGLYHDDLPVTSDAGVVVMPYSMNPNDGWNFRTATEGGDFERATRDGFDQLYEDSRTIPRVFSLPLHPFVLGQPSRIRHVRALLDHIVGKPGIWIADGESIAAWHTGLGQPREPSGHAPV